MNCPNCKIENSVSAKYCTECGTPLFKKCDNCGSTTTIKAKYCPNCGKQHETLDIEVIRYKNKLTFYDNIIIRKSKSGKYIVARNDNKYILLNIKSLSPILDFCFEEVGTEKEYDDYCFLRKDGKWGIINPVTGKSITNFIYDAYLPNDHNGAEFRVFKDGLWGKVNANTGATTIPHLYEEIEYDDRVRQNGYWGWLSTNNNKVPCEYISLSGYTLSDNIRPSLHKSGKWGVINKLGDIIIEFEYDEIEYHEPFGHSVYYLRKGSHWGVYCEGRKYACIYSKDEVSNIKLW